MKRYKTYFGTVYDFGRWGIHIYPRWVGFSLISDKLIFEWWLNFLFVGFGKYTKSWQEMAEKR